MADINEISVKLKQGRDGVWHSSNKISVSYPVDGNLWCGQVEDRSYWFIHRNRVIREVLRKFPPKGWVADIGGGNGFVAQFLQKSGYEMVLVEPGEDGIRLAQQRGIRQIVGTTLQDAEFQPNSIPAAGLFDTLEHIRDDLGILKDLHGILKPGGRLYITVPSYQGLRSVEDDYVGHVHRYSRKALIRILDQAGFVMDYSSYFFTFLIFPIFFLRSLPYHLGLVKKFDEKWFIRQLDPESPFLDRLVYPLINWEVKRIAGTRSIVFGSSLIVAASKK